jgi:hypothetical protein
MAAAEPSRPVAPLQPVAKRPAPVVAVSVPDGARIAQRIVTLTAEQQRDPTAVRAAGVAALGKDVPLSSLFEVLVAYAAAVAKEAREDKKLVRTAKDLERTLKGAELALANEAIDAGLREAKEKADIAMEAAWIGLAMGVAQGLIQVGAAAGSFAGAAGASSSAASAVSDVALVAGAARDVSSSLPPEALAEVPARLDDLLSRATRAWDAGASVTSAITTFLASNAVLAKVDRARLFPWLVLAAYEKALDDVKTAMASGKPPSDAKLKRARLTALALRALARKLRAQ